MTTNERLHGFDKNDSDDDVSIKWAPSSGDRPSGEG